MSSHLRVVPEQTNEQRRVELISEARTLWAGLGVVLLNSEGARNPTLAYDLARKGERMSTALSIVYDELAKLAEAREEGN